jgi:hypothetical protein
MLRNIVLIGTLKNKTMIWQIMIVKKPKLNAHAFIAEPNKTMITNSMTNKDILKCQIPMQILAESTFL